MKFKNNLIQDKKIVPNDITDIFQNFLLEEAEKTYSIEFEDIQLLQKPLKKEEELKRSENRYQRLFEESPVSLWEEDFSKVISYLNRLKESGINDFRRYFSEHPKEVEKCVSKVKILDVNQATLALFKAQSKAELTKNLKNVFTEESYDTFQEELIAIAEGALEFSSEFTGQNLKGKIIHAELRLSISNSVDDYSSIALISILDITKRKIGEQLLKKSQKQFDQAITALNHPFYVINTQDYTLQFVNRATTNIFGEYTPKTTCYALTHGRTTPCDGEKHPCPMKEVLSTKQSVILEHQHRDKKGVTKTFELHGYPIFDDYGEVQHIIEYSINITKRKNIEKSLKESEERLTSFMEAATSNCTLFDSKLNFIYVNKIARKVVSLPTEKIIGKSMIDLNPELKGSDRLKKYHDVVKTGQGLFIDEMTFENRIYSIQAFKAGSGLGMISTDITKRKKMEKSLIESEERLRAFMDSAPDNFIILDSKLNILESNEISSRVFGISIEEIIGKNLIDLNPELKGSDRLKKYHDVVKTGQNFFIDNLEFNNRIFSIRAFKAGNGLGIISTDITEKRKTHVNLHKNEERLRSFMNSVTDSFYLLDSNLNIIDLNSNAISILKQERNNIIGKSIADIDPKLKNSNRISKYKEILKTGIPLSENDVISHSDFGNKHYNVRVFQIEDGLGIFSSDITAYIESQENLKKRSNELSERIKELDCLYSVSRILENLQKPISEVFIEIISTISAAMQLPDIACARIILNDERVIADNFVETEWNISTEIRSSDLIEGSIEVFYKQKPPDSEVLFLNEEQNLIQGISRQISEYLFRKRFAEELKHSEERMRSLVENSPDIITIVDKNAIVQFINNNTYDYTIEEMVGKKFYKFIQSKYHRKFRKVINNVFKNKRAISIETTEERKDGSIVWYENHIAPILRDNKVDSIMVITRDITNRIMEGKLRVSLEEKDVLLQEIHHRVKNNLQVISSLLNIQSKRLEDKQALEFFKKSQDRVQSMALIHEKLYRSEDITKIDFGNYVEELTTQLSISHGLDRKSIRWKIDIENIFFDLTLAIPCGLIINELVSNSLKHAFPKDRKGEIYIKMSIQRRKKVTLLIGDDGIGFEREMDFSQIDTLGLQLVNTLVRQINGSISLNKDKKAEYRIIFHANKN